jgi:hypothetical protein
VADGAFILGDSPGMGIHIDEAVIRAAHPVTSQNGDGPHIRPSAAGRRLLASTDGTPGPVLIPDRP